MTQTDRVSDEVAVHGKDAEGKDANGDSPKNRELETSGRSTAEPSRADVASDSRIGGGRPEQVDRGRNRSMHTTHRGVLITVIAIQNERGAWLAQISATREGRPLALPHVEPSTPEWLTESEALRAGIEHGRFLVGASVPSSDVPDASPNPVPRE